MKLIKIAAVMAGMCLVSSAAMAADTTTTSGMSKGEQVSYALGMSIGQGLKQQDVQIDQAHFIKGMTDALKGDKLQMTNAQMKAVLMDFQKDMMAKQQAKMQAVADKNMQAGEKYLTANKSKAGVVSTQSGLQYKILTAGSGAKPTKDDKVTVDYEGRLIDGTVFDSSYKSGKPATFAINQVIQGWQEVLPLMPVGSTWEVTIPAKLAYGKMGAGGLIGPNETLVFKIHLKDIVKDQADNSTAKTEATDTKAVATEEAKSTTAQPKADATTAK